MHPCTRLTKPMAALLAATLVGMLLTSGCSNAPGPSSSDNPYAATGAASNGGPPAGANGAGPPGMGGPGANGGR